MRKELFTPTTAAVHEPDPAASLCSALLKPGRNCAWKLCRISGKLHRLRLLSIAEPIYVRWQYLGGAAGTGCTALPVQPVALTVKKLNSNSSGTKQLINILKSQACSNVKPNLLH